MGPKQAKLDPKEEAKQHKRTITRAIRQIERERGKLQNQEAKVLREIKTLAQKNQHVSIFKMFTYELHSFLGTGKSLVEGSGTIEAAD